MNKYQDIFETKIVLDEKMEELGEDEKKLFQAKLVFGFGKRDEKNKNGRYYPGKTWDPAVENFGEALEKSWKLGDLDHPLEGGTKLSSASHLLSKVWLDDDGKGMAEAYILRTSKGNDFLTILKSKVKIGASLRGLGEVDSNGNVKPGMKILAIDFVENPSFGSNAAISQANIIESFIPVEEERSEGIGELSFQEKTLSGIFRNPPKEAPKGKSKSTDTERNHFLEYIVAGGTLLFEDWKKQREEN